jgi:hypothetical protein
VTYDQLIVDSTKSTVLNITSFALFLFSAKALDEYAAIQSRATWEEKNDGQWLQAIVERMLDKYDSFLMVHCFLVC